MAIVPNSYIEVTLGIADLDLNKSDLSVKLPSTATLAQVTAFIADLIAAVDPITNGIVYGYSISLGARELDPTVVAVEASDVQRKGSFAFRASNGTPMKLEIPSLDNAKVVDFSNIINPADAAVITFIDLIVNGDGTLAPVSNAGSSVATFRGAEKIHRASGRG